MIHGFGSWKGLQHGYVLLEQTTLETCRQGARNKAGTSGRGEVEQG